MEYLLAMTLVGPVSPPWEPREYICLSQPAKRSLVVHLVVFAKVSKTVFSPDFER